jgi:glycosyltransferase involved in cell wall biosynthesis
MGDQTHTPPTSTAAVTPGVSVVLPAYNAAEVIEDTVAALRQELRPVTERLELVIVDDGSRDATADVVTTLRRRHDDVRLLRNRTNLGKGLAVYLGILASRHSHVCFTDADLAFSPGSYARIVQRAVDSGKLVVASRRLPDSEIQVRMEVLGYASRRHLIGVAFNHMVRLALALPYRDTQCGLKAFERETGIGLFRRVRSTGFLFDIELFLAARELHTAIEEIPVRIVYNDFKSSVRLAGDSARFLSSLATIWGRARRGEYATVNPEMAPEKIWLQTEEVDGA